MNNINILYKVVTLHRKSIIAHSTAYELIYNKDQIVTARVGTLGIFCFETLYDAECWIDEVGFYPCQYIILKIEPMSKVEKNSKKISRRITSKGLKSFYACNKNSTCGCYTKEAPHGTVCIQRGHVLT